MASGKVIFSKQIESNFVLNINSIDVCLKSSVGEVPTTPFEVSLAAIYLSLHGFIDKRFCFLTRKFWAQIIYILIIEKVSLILYSPVSEEQRGHLITGGR